MTGDAALANKVRSHQRGSEVQINRRGERVNGQSTSAATSAWQPRPMLPPYRAGERPPGRDSGGSTYELVKRDTTHVPVGDKRERKIIESPRPIAVLPRRRIRSEERRSSSSGHRTGTSSSSGTDTEPKWVINVTTPSKTQAEFEEQERREAEEADLIRRQLSL